MTGALRFSFTGNWAAPGDETSWTGAWRAVGEHGIAPWDGEEAAGGVPPGECHDNLRSLAMCHAAVESAALGAPVPVPAA